jgi:hypothetical protein
VPDPSDPAVRVEADVLTVGLVATPPDHPAQVVERLSGALPALLAQADGAVRWEVEAGWGEVAPRRDGGVEALLDDVARRRDEAGWDVVVCLTDLPLQRGRVPLVAHSSVRRRACVVSLPALGIGQLRGTRTIVPGLVAGLVAAGSERSADEPFGSRVERQVPVRRVVDDADDGEVGFVSSRVWGGLRLVVGMVRANRPARALAGLSKLTVGAFGTAAFALATNTIWQMADALDGLRLSVIMILAIGALVAWLIVVHDLWESPSPQTPSELARLFNIGTVATLVLAAAISYLVLLVGLTAVAALLIDISVLDQALGRPVGVVDYLTLAWLISSLPTVGGAIGSGLEDEQAVRAVAYGYHPEPVGWLDERRDAGSDD